MDDSNIPASGLVLYIWPGQWGLPSFEPLCLASVLYLQLAIPNKFRVIETANPDSSPTGQLPYLVHNQHIVTSLPSILKYVSDLRSADHSQFPNASLDLHLTALQKSQRTAWFAHVESMLVDLVAYNLFYVEENWENVTAPTLSSMYPVPQRYYVAKRIREDYFVKLSANKLTNELINDKAHKSHPQPASSRSRATIREEVKVRNAFLVEKLTTKAKEVFDIFQFLLGDKRYIFGEEPSSLDVLIASNLLLIHKPPFQQESVLKSVLVGTYPNLLDFSQRIYDSAFATGTLDITFASKSVSIASLFPTLPKGHRKKEKSPEDVKFQRMRWAFFGLVLGSFSAYLSVVMRGIEIKWVEDGSDGGEPEAIA